ncbi:MAG: cadherin-like beta sandwich domain-containing protein, partial [Gammaproteobacteria bacterium]|nr:cadherin-like beta sandwich domain-containing protein [Gammaproteobacteria bacterium]
MQWMDISGADTNIYEVLPTTTSISYRVVAEYTDGQGYETELEIGEFLYKAFCDYATDIDQDDDGLIEICDSDGLDAIRYQLDGSGYKASAAADIITTGCPDGGCKGYELTGDLDLAKVDNWLPINAFAGIFEGNGFTISNLKINRPDTFEVGLFGTTINNAEINNVGLLNVDIKGSTNVGGLVGESRSSIAGSYVSGHVNGDINVGGLVGESRSSITDSYAIGSVDGSSGVGGLVGHNDNNILRSYAGGRVNGYIDVGGLVGNNGANIANSYANGSVDGERRVGGLIGAISTGITKNNYAIGSVVGETNVGGLVGNNFGDVANSYWDTETSGLLTSAGGISKTTVELQTPTSPTGIYSMWSTDDWDFGSASQYPVLKDANGNLLLPALRYGLSRLRLTEGHLSPDFVAVLPSYAGTVVNDTNTIELIPTAVNPAARIRIKSGEIDEQIASGGTSSEITLNTEDTTTITIVVINSVATIEYDLSINYYSFSGDIDRDDDGLIEIDDVAGLNAIRYQADGTGYRRTSTDPKVTTGCPDNLCIGYELTGDLDLAKVDNWLPINAFEGVFEGNGYTISNLKIDRPDAGEVGLFGYIRVGSEINNVGLLNANVRGGNNVGSLVGENNYGTITDSYATGFVNGGTSAGGLVGSNLGDIANSYAAVSVARGLFIGGLVGDNSGDIANSYAIGTVAGDSDIGGLVGRNNDVGSIANSYANGTVLGETTVGVLDGNNSGNIANSYAIGFVDGGTNAGGLVGSNSGDIANSYWDKEASERATSDGGIGETTVNLQTPTTATGIYSEWSDDNWDFGSASQYPILKDENGNLLSPALRYGLNRLRLTEGDLSPDFAGPVLNYVGTVVGIRNMTQLIPTAVNPAARIRIKSGEIDDEIASGAVSSEITLNTENITTITIVVTDSGVTTEYNLYISYFRPAIEDIDEDDDGLIEIDDAAGLDAIRHQPDGTGYRRTSTEPKVATGCPDDGCKGYELTGNLDLAKEDNWLPIKDFA